MGMWVRRQDGLAFVDNTGHFQDWVLKSKTYKKYSWILNFQFPIDITSDVEDDPESDAILHIYFETAPEDNINPFNTDNQFCPYGQKEQEEFANTVVGFCSDLIKEIEENIQKIF